MFTTGPQFGSSARRYARHARFALLLVLATIGFGCSSSNKWVALRSTPRNPLTDALGLVARQGPKPTDRTLQLLRRYDLEKMQGDREALLAKLSEIDQREPNREHLYAMSELAYVGAKRAERSKDAQKALGLYGSSVLYSYQYLFDDRAGVGSNPYDPQFRRACDLYNAALEGTLRLVKAKGTIRPGDRHILSTPHYDCQLEIVLKSRGWRHEDFDDVEFVTDYEVHGLRNHYQSYGLGVPLVAVRRHHEEQDPREQFYPPDLSFPITAFMRIQPEHRSHLERGRTVPASATTASGSEGRPVLRAVLELYDPLDESAVQVAGARVPLETDLSTPLAYFLSQPALDDDRVSTLGLLNPGEAKQLTGLYMLEPFRGDKIPVVMVHGLWSSPVTWMEMFNDLRSDPFIRQHYQFWFYLYPSGQPFWFSAAQMRRDLASMRKSLDPYRQQPALDQTVLVGHSMGGLVSRLQTVDSGNQFWQTLSEKPFAQLDADPEIRDNLAGAFFFDPNPSIRRVITIGTPHRGSDFSNDFTRWLSSKLIRIPNMLMYGRNQLYTRNPDFFRNDAPLKVETSIDSLSPKSPVLPVLLAADTGPWVTYHNIIGRAPNKGVKGAVSHVMVGEGDGVVAMASAKLEQAESEIVVPADHVSVHRHPQSILEVRRILQEHYEQLRTFPYGEIDVRLVNGQGAPMAGPRAPPDAAQHALTEQRSPSATDWRNGSPDGRAPHAAPPSGAPATLAR